MNHKSDNRPDKDRPQRSERDNRDRSRRPERDSRDDRPQKSGRDGSYPRRTERDNRDRPQRSERDNRDRSRRPERDSRDDRPQKSGRDGSYPRRTERDNRDRPQRSERDARDRPQRTERDNRDRPQRSERDSRDNRPYRTDQDKSADDIPTVRDTAAKVYAHWLRHPSRIDVAAQQILKQRSSGAKTARWSPRDKALFQELIYGVVRYHGRIEWLVNELSSKNPPSDHLAYASVAIGIYQLLYLDRVPAYAAVDAAVSIVRYAAGEMTSKWANAVLRKVSAAPEEFRTSVPQTKDPLYALSILHSYPLWMIEHWHRTMNMEMLERFLIWNNGRPHIFLRTNTTRIDPEKLASLLTNNFDHHSKIDPNFLSLEHSGSSGGDDDDGVGGDVDHWKLVKSGLASVQDVSQGLVSRLLDPQDVEEILDLCSAPGGKTGHLAELSPNCRIIATD
ncbi:MAG: transcription antitermination factor NusB, partial [Candidatus Electryoneaceae bacterium]|nr:transcription antitermination factor NusB [Candidatus Electryoneaceae bacterium]